jgi:hypothetical protein
MSFPRHRFSSSSLIAAAILAAVALTLTGCAIDATNTASSSGSANITGLIHGGPNPVANATVSLYATQSNGYGGAALQLGTSTTSAADGSFSFNASSYTCPAGQQAYVVSSGGNTGANAANPNSLLIAAIGPCANLTAATSVWIDEASTIAAAYALSNFITISGTTVNISSSANNNATSGSCTGTGSSMTCQAAGLTHAFLNAANLVSASNSTGIGTTAPTGQAYITPPSNPTTASTAVALQNVVPQQLINSLANAVQACVNSTGTTGTSDTTSGCGQLFTNTTVPTTFSSNTTYTAKPANTLQALVNLAKFPFMTSSAVTNIFNLAAGSSFYQPTLTAAPPDFSIAILWRSYTTGVNQIGTPYFTATDINDDVYATALTGIGTGTILGAVPYLAHSLSSDGVGNWAAPATILSTAAFAPYTCDSWGGTASTSGSCMAATDTAGHLWVSMGSTNFTGGGLWQVSQSTGVATQFTTTVSSTTYYPEALAVDANNDLFYTSANTATMNFWKMPAGSTSTTVPSPLTTGGTALAAGHTSGSIVLDTNGSIFAPEDSGGNVGFTYALNTGTLSAEAFATTANNTNALTTNSPVGLAVDNWPTGGMVDASGNYWFTDQSHVIRILAADAQTVATGASTGYTAFTVGNSATTLRVSSMDGAGTIFVPDNNTNGTKNPQGSSPTSTAPALLIYYPALAGTVSIQGCNVGAATGNTACITGNATAPNSGLFYQAVNPAIDSTGSMWVSSEGNDAIIQVIGLAAPTWPQTSYLHPSVMPQ